MQRNVTSGEAVEAQTAEALPWVVQWVGRHRRVVLTFVVLFYLAAFNGAFRIGSDASLYVEVARSLAAGEGYTYQGRAESLVYPGLPWMLAGVFRVFGPEAIWAANALMLGFTLVALGLFYRTFRLRLGVGHATVIVVLTAVCETTYRYAFQLLTEMPFLCGIAAVLAGWEGLSSRGRGKPELSAWRDALDLALLAMGLVFLTLMRPVMLVVLAAVGLAAGWRLLAGPRRWTAVMLGVLALGSVGLFDLVDPRGHEPLIPQGVSVTYEARAVGAVSNARSGRAFAFLAELTSEGTLAEALLGLELGLAPINAAFAATAGLAGLALARRRPMWGLIVAAVLAQSLVFKPIERYLLPIIPLLMAGWWLLLHAGNRWTGRKWNALWVAGLALAFLPNLVFSSKFLVSQRQTPFLASYDKGYYVPIAAMAADLPSHVAPEALIFSDAGPQLTAMGERDVVSSTELYAQSARSPGSARAWVLEQPAVYVVLEANRQQAISLLALKQLKLKPGEAIATHEGPRGAWSLHRVLEAEAEQGAP